MRGGRAHFATKGEVRSQEGGAPKRWEAINGDRREKKRRKKEPRREKMSEMDNGKRE